MNDMADDIFMVNSNPNPTQNKEEKVIETN